MDTSSTPGDTPVVTAPLTLHDIEPTTVMFNAAQPYATAGVYNAKGGIVTYSDQAGDSDDVIMFAANADYIDVLEERGYSQDESLPVEIGNGEHEHERESIWPQLLLGKAVQGTNLKNREVERVNEDGTTERYITENPFDTNGYVELTSDTVESRPDGMVASYEDELSEQMENPTFLAGVGRYNHHNGVLAWTTAAGAVQIAPLSEVRIARLEAMGYELDGSVAVPHSNGEEWLTGDDQPKIRDVVTGEVIGTAADIWERLKEEQ